MHIVHNRLIQSLIAQHLTDERWREVFLLAAGLMGRRGNELLASIDLQARAIISSRLKLCNLIHWVEQITRNSQSGYKAFCDRAFAIAVASGSAFGKVRSISSPGFKASVRSIERAKARNNTIEIDVAVGMARKGAFDSDITMTVAGVIELAIEIASDIENRIEVNRAEAIDSVSSMASAIDNIIDASVISEIAMNKAIESACRSVEFFSKVKIFDTKLVKNAFDKLSELKKYLA